MVRMRNVKKLLEDADRAYYEGVGVSPLSDAEYDSLREHYPRESAVGSEVDASHATKVSLPQWMGSMNKRTEALYTSDSVVISDKLDGVSALFTGEKLFTRGNGKIGRDVSHLLPVLRMSPMDLRGDFVRGELVISKSDFENIKDKYSNARNTVSGFVNAKAPDKQIGGMVHFVAYELTPSDKKKVRLSPKEQFRKLKSLNMKIVHHRYLSTGASTGTLQKMLEDRNEMGSYEIDGLIVAMDREYEYISSGNPLHAHAFKPKTNCISSITVVRQVIWRLSKDGFMKPRVMFDPVEIDGAQIQFATGENARYIQKNRIGAGAVIEVIRSGKVIPHIVRVITPAAEGSLPKDVEFSWTPSGVDIVAKHHGPLSESAFIHTLKKMEIPTLGDKKAALLYASGYNTLGKVMKISKEELMKLDGFKETSAKKLIDAIRDANPTCIQLMVASNSFGRGLSEHVLQLITRRFSLSSGKPDVVKVKEIDGVGAVRAQSYVDGYDKFIQFLTANEMESFCRTGVNGSDDSESQSARDDVNAPNIVLTGFRDGDMESKLGKARLANTITKRTAILVVDYAGKFSQSKIDAAKSKQIMILSRSDPLYARIVTTYYDDAHKPCIEFA